LHIVLLLCPVPITKEAVFFGMELILRNLGCIHGYNTKKWHQEKQNNGKAFIV